MVSWFIFCFCFDEMNIFKVISHGLPALQLFVSSYKFRESVLLSTSDNGFVITIDNLKRILELLDNKMIINSLFKIHRKNLLILENILNDTISELQNTMLKIVLAKINCRSVIILKIFAQLDIH